MVPDVGENVELRPWWWECKIVHMVIPGFPLVNSLAVSHKVKSTLKI